MANLLQQLPTDCRFSPFRSTRPQYRRATHAGPDLASAEMAKLVLVLRSGLDTADAEGVEALVENIARDTPFTQNAAARLKGMLPKLGKSAYDIAVKIISDIASETVKKIMGL